MPGRLRECLIWMVVLTGGLALAAAPATVFTRELDTELYNCTLTLAPAPHLPATSTMQLWLEKEGDDGLQLTFTSTAVSINVRRNGAQIPCGTAAYPTLTTFPCRVTVQRRGDQLMLLTNEHRFFTGRVPRTAGDEGAVTIGAGWGDPRVAVQRLEPVAFADNFMRTEDEPGPWTRVSGTWILQSAWDRDPKGNARRFTNAQFALNPFAWVGMGREPALCVTGQPFWEDYTLTAAVCPAAGGAVGLAVNLDHNRNGWLVRWTPANATGAGGNRLTLNRLVNGKLTVVASDSGGYLPGQWSKLSVVSRLDRLQVLVDGRERLVLENPSPWHGGIGLYAEGEQGTVFDDVTAYGSLLKQDLIAESVLAHLNERFRNDTKGMGQWADTAIDWTGFPGHLGASLGRWDYTGDHWMVLTLMRKTADHGEAMLALKGNGIDPASGYRVVITASAGKGKTSYAVSRDGEVFFTSAGDPLELQTEYEIRFRHTGERLQLEKDGEVMLDAADPAPLPGLRPAYQIGGSLSALHSPLILGRQVIDETFAEAPVNWIGDGTWMATTRWSCSSQWSFLAGWSRGKAALWHKQRFVGDQTLQAFVAPKMEYPREHQNYAQRFRDMAITICGDGRDPASGYAGIFGAPGDDGLPNRRAVLLRNGVVVGTAPAVMPNWQNGHIEWFDLILKKRGAEVEFWIGDRKMIAYSDPQPLQGGVPAIWTTDNGITVSRVRLMYAQPPLPRLEPRVVIEAPWYPEWANIGQPLTLTFRQAIATSGKPVQLRVAAAAVPAGDEQSVTPAGDVVSVNPSVIGDHWYQVTATDGQEISPATHLSLKVYQPALGRDDSHAVVLYRFDEGRGNIVRDQSRIAPAADLTIEHAPGEDQPPVGKGAQPAAWYPGQGLHLPAPNRLASTGGVAKLMALAKSKAATLELWVSPDTVFPMTDWLGVMLTWEKPYDGFNERRNFGCANIAYFWTFSPRGTAFGSRFGRGLTVQGARNGLQHLVITWDGRATRFYVDGEQQGEQWGSWQPEQWDADAPLLLANQPAGPLRPYLYEAQSLTGARDDIIGWNANGQHAFIGAYYLVAIHDRSFSDEEILRHYQAGPSAR